MDVSTLSVRVESKGIDTTTKSLEGLEKRAGTTEAAVMSLMDKLGKSSASVLSVVQSMNQLRAAMQGALPNNAISASLSDFKKMADEIKNIQSMMGKGVGGNISITIKDIGTGSKEAVKGVESLNQSLASGQNALQMFGKELYHIRNLLGGTMLAGALINTAQSAIKMADAWTLMGAKLKTQVGSAYAAADAQEKLYVMAQQLRVPLQGVTQLFTRLVPAMNEYGYSMKDAMSVTQAMAAALKVSGATAAEASSVMLQFSQSMQAGRLNGAEFNAIAEGAPIILRLIGQEINKTRGELKKMGADGVISVELITEVLKKNKDALTGMSSAVPDTVESAFTNLTNALTKYIGQANNAIGVTGVIAAAIKLLAENLDLVGSVLKYVAIAGFAAYTASLTSALIQMAIAPALSASLAAELGLVGTAATGAAGGVGILNGALLILARNPAIVIFTLLATGAAYVYDKFQQAEQSTKSFTNQLAELDKLKGSQAVQAYASAIDEVLDNLSKENNKLTELIEKRKKAYKFSDIMAYNDAIEDQKKAVTSLAEKYGVLAQRQADVNSGMALKRVSEAIKALQEENKWLDYQISQRKKLKDIDKTIFDLESQIATAKDGFHKDELKNLLIEAKGKKARIDTLDEIDKASKKSSKEQESLAQKLEKSYLSALNSAEAFLESQQEELGLKRKLTESEKEYEKIMRTVSDLKSKFRGADVNELENIANRIKKLGEEKRARGELNAFLDKEQELKLQAIALEAQYADNQFKSVQALRDKINLQKLSNLDVQQTPLGTQLDSQQNDQDRINFLQQQITLTSTLIDLEIQKAYWEAYANNDSAGMARAEKAGEELQKRIDGYNNEIRSLQALLPLQEEYTQQLALTAKKDMLDIGRSPGQILADGFGEAGAAISKMSDAYKAYANDRIKLDKYIADQVKAQQKFGPPDVAKIDKEVADKRVQISAGMYASMAGAAKGFFTEHSKGYAIMEKAEKAFRALELALAIKNFVQKMFFTKAEIAANETKSVSAIAGNALEIASNWALAQVKAVLAFVTQGSGDPYTAFGRMAAMAAILAAVGLSISGASGGGGKNVSQDRQAAQGAGTVFGDTTAKSESITKSLDLIKDNTKISSQYNAGMLAALQNIEAALTGAATAIIRQGVGPSSINTKNGIAAFGISPSSALGKTQTSFVEKLANIDQILKENFLPMLGGDALTKVFGLKTSVKDTGITSQSQTIADILAKGFSGLSYATIEEKARFRKTKQHDVTEILPEDTNKQFSLVIGSLATSIKESGKALGLDSQAFTDRLNTFVVDIGTISLEGMSSDKIKETLTNVFSKLGDQMATAALADLDEFQKVGEGYFETLTRVASTVATVDGIFKTVGTTFGQVGLDGVKAKMHLIDLAGGLENLSGLVSGFFEKFYTDAEQKATLAANVSQKLISLGITGLDVTAKDGREAFRRVVEQYKDTNSEVFIELLKLSDSVDKLAPAFADTASAADIAASKLSMDIDLLNLQGKSIEAVRLQRERELATLDDSLKPIQQLVWTLSDLKAAASTSLSGLEKSVSVEKTNLKTALDAKLKVIDEAKAAENKRYEDEKKAIQDRVDAANAAIDLENKAKDARVDSLKIQLDALKESKDNIKTLFDDISNSIDTLTGSVESLNVMSYEAAKNQLDTTLAIAKATGKLPDPKTFKDILTSITSVNADSFSSAFDLNREKLVSAGKLTGLQSITGDTLSNQELAIKKMEDTIKAIEDSKQQSNINAKIDLDAAGARHEQVLKDLEDQQKVLKDQYEVDVFYLDGILAEAKKQLDIANGTYTATLGVKDAVVDFATQLAAYVAQQDAKNADMANQLTQMAIGTIPTLTAIAQRSSDDNAALTQQVKDLQESLAAANRAIAENTKETAKVLSRWDGDGQPETRVV